MAIVVGDRARSPRIRRDVAIGAVTDRRDRRAGILLVAGSERTAYAGAEAPHLAGLEEHAREVMSHGQLRGRARQRHFLGHRRVDELTPAEQCAVAVDRARRLPADAEVAQATAERVRRVRCHDTGVPVRIKADASARSKRKDKPAKSHLG